MWKRINHSYTYCPKCNAVIKERVTMVNEDNGAVEFDNMEYGCDCDIYDPDEEAFANECDADANPPDGINHLYKY